jgi:hypothetical protein
MSLVAYSRTAPSFTDRVFDLLDHVDYRQAITDAEKDAVYRLRYEAYLREGAIPENFSQRLSDRFDDLDNTWIMGVFVDGRLAGSIRLSISSPAYRDMPATKVFPDFLESELDAEKTIIDPTRFVIDQNMARSYPELPYVTTRTRSSRRCAPSTRPSTSAPSGTSWSPTRATIPRSPSRSASCGSTMPP